MTSWSRSACCSLMETCSSWRLLAPRSLITLYHSSSLAAGSKEVRFDSPEAVTRGKSTWEVFRGWLVFKMFSYNWLVDRNLQLYRLSKRLIGTRLTEKLLRATIFGQFAGGLSEQEMEAVVRKLAKRNISSIWFFSIERDLEEVNAPRSQQEFEEQERFFDEVNHKYLKSIEMTASCNCDRARRFAAIKLTAIVNPHLLSKLNRLLVESNCVFKSLASPGERTVDRAIPLDLLRKTVPDFEVKEGQLNRTVGIVDWVRHFSIAGPLEHFAKLKSVDSNLVSFSDMELEQYARFILRLQMIGKCAESEGASVLIDAEQTYFQQAIEHLTLHLLARAHNSSKPLVYNTLQTYLVDSFDSLVTYLEVSKQYGILSAIKVVRGCYLELERQHARDQNKTSPIHATKPLTEASYHHTLTYLLDAVKSNKTHIMVASHSKETVERALELIRDYEISREDGRVTFGQLLGMGDHLTYPLASAGFIANKVVPYGGVDDIVPFLSRRGNENRGMMKNAQVERSLYLRELRRRMFRRN